MQDQQQQGGLAEPLPTSSDEVHGAEADGAADGGVVSMQGMVMPASCPVQYAALVRRCTALEPATRVTAGQLLDEITALLASRAWGW